MPDRYFVHKLAATPAYHTLRYVVCCEDGPCQIRTDAGFVTAATTGVFNLATFEQLAKGDWWTEVPQEPLELDPCVLAQAGD